MDNIKLTVRQSIILKIVVEDYINLAEPIGSKAILEKWPKSKVIPSSATIRNECVLLQLNGLLLKEHSSSGRVPSTNGYRYYINNLMKRKKCDLIKFRIEKIFKNRNLTIEEILNKSSEILSEMTKLTTLVISPNIQNEVLKKVYLHKVDDKKILLILVLSNGYTKNNIFNISSNLSFQDLQLCVNIFNKRLENVKLCDLYHQIKLIKPIIENQIKESEYILKQFLIVISSISKLKKTTHGIQYMLQNPEFSNTNNIKKAIQLIESISSFDFFERNGLNKNNDLDINFKIGDEIDMDGCKNISLISANYLFNSNRGYGKLALVGPKRIEYNKMVELMEWLSKRIEKYYKRE